MSKTYCTLTEEDMRTMFVSVADEPTKFLDPRRAERAHSDDRLKVNTGGKEHLLLYTSFIHLKVGVNPIRAAEDRFDLQAALRSRFPKKEDFQKRVNHIQRAFRTFRGDRVVDNGPAVRIADFSNDVFTLQRAGYFDQCRTNLIADAQTRDGFSVRSISYEPNTRRLLPFAKSPLANTLGAAAVVHFMDPHTGDRHYFGAVRYAKSGVFTESIGQVSGVVDSIPSSSDEKLLFTGKLEGYAYTDNDLRSIVYNSILKELKQEVGFSEESVKHIEILGVCRELLRAGKPQAFLDVELHAMTVKEFERTFNSARHRLLSFQPDEKGSRLTSEHLASYALHLHYRDDSTARVSVPIHKSRSST